MEEGLDLQTWDREESVLRCSTCGYATHPGMTEGQARRAVELHDCERQLAQRERTARRLVREAAIDRTPQPCPHRRKHEHGTEAACRQDGCHCIPCAEADRAARAERARQVHYGRAKSGYVDALPARSHVRVMTKRMSDGAAAKAIGIDLVTLQRIKTAKAGKRIQAATAERVLSTPITIAAVPPKSWVSPLGTARRIQGAIAEGWPAAELARRIGYSNQSSVNHLAALTDEVIERRTAERIAAVLDSLPAAAPESPAADRARARARRRGWVPTMAWDDIDDPLERPKGVAA